MDNEIDLVRTSVIFGTFDLDLWGWPQLTFQENLDFSISRLILQNSLIVLRFTSKTGYLTLWPSKVMVNNKLTIGYLVNFSSSCKKCTKSLKMRHFAPDINHLLTFPNIAKCRLETLNDYEINIIMVIRSLICM